MYGKEDLEVYGMANQSLSIYSWSNEFSRLNVQQLSLLIISLQTINEKWLAYLLSIDTAGDDNIWLLSINEM